VKLSLKLAGITGTGAFLLVSLMTYVGSMDVLGLLSGHPQQLDAVMDLSLAKPLKVLTLALPSVFIAGFLGYFLGNVLSHPKGPIKKPTKPEAPKSPLDDLLAQEGLTGEETFLEDLETSDVSSDPPVTGLEEAPT